MLPNTILVLNKWPKIYKTLPRWRNFAKSGHTTYHQVLQQIAQSGRTVL